jgi:hypothetical protein
LQRGEALLGGERRIANFLRIAQQGGGDRAAQIDVDAAPFSVAIGLREAGKSGIHAALKGTPFDNCFSRSSGVGDCCTDQYKHAHP